MSEITKIFDERERGKNSYLETDRIMIEMRRLKNVFFFPNNFKFCGVKKDYMTIPTTT